jgi:hypothetical protein
MRFQTILFLVAYVYNIFSDNMFLETPAPPTDMKDTLNLTTTTGGPYTYSQSQHHFYGTAYDGTYIDTYGCCSGQSGTCRNNPSCQCKVSIGPLPQGTYTLGNMMTFKGMSYCYELFPSSTNNMCGRSGFLIHGGSCSGNPSEGCIVIEDQNTRYRIKSGATLKVVS